MRFSSFFKKCISPEKSHTSYIYKQSTEESLPDIPQTVVLSITIPIYMLLYLLTQSLSQRTLSLSSLLILVLLHLQSSFT